MAIEATLTLHVSEGIILKPYPKELVHRKTPDGAYFWHGENNDPSRCQVVIVGKLKGIPDEYAAAAARQAGWSRFKSFTEESMPACDPAAEADVRARGFLSIIVQLADQ